MNEVEILGYVLLALSTLGGFFILVQKITQPINELRLVVQELKGCISSIKEDADLQNKRLNKHGEEIDNLIRRMDKFETRMNLYHKE